MRLRKEQAPESFNWVDFHLNPVTGSKVEIPDATEEVTEEVAKEVEYDTISICLRYLRVKEMNEMQSEVYNINAEMKGNKKGTVTSKFDYGLYTERKMLTAIVEWKNVQDEDGEPAPVNAEFLQLLPGWIGETLIEIIDDMNDMGTEILEK